MNPTIRNILAGIGSFPVVISLIIGISYASGINMHYVLIPVIITNLVATILNPNDNTFYQLPVSLVVIFATILHENTLDLSEPSLASLIMLLIPAVVFTALSFSTSKFGLIPVSTIFSVSFGIGVVVVLKQTPHAFGYEPGQAEGLNAMNWIQFFLAISIPILALIGNRIYKDKQLLPFIFIAVSITAILLPIEHHTYQLEQFNIDQFIIRNWGLSFLELKSAIIKGITISILLLCIFWGNLSVISKEGFSKEMNVRKSLRTVGIGNIIGSFLGIMPTNIGLVETAAISENKGQGKITLYTIIALLAICAFVKIPDFGFPLLPSAGLLIYIGLRLITKSFRLLKGKHPLNYIIGIIGGLLIIFTDFILGFLFALMFGLIYEAFGKKKEDNVNHHC